MTKDDKEIAQRLMDRADKILASVDEAYIISQRGHRPRLMPMYRPEEITLGKILGTGGFGIVSEIAKFTLDPEESDAQDKVANEILGDNFDANTNECVSKTVSNPEEMTDGYHVHYDVRKARKWMEKKCQRNGVSRYALKRLHDHLSDVERARGTIDLAVEAKYLSVVWHPNISKFCQTRTFIAPQQIEPEINVLKIIVPISLATPQSKCEAWPKGAFWTKTFSLFWIACTAR
jgi:hypothetical protein